MFNCPILSALLLLFAFPFAQAENIRVGGVSQPVEIIRDRWGVPHIYAQSTHDLFFAQGYITAKDRLWQIDLWRRIGTGKLAEVLGPSAIERDKLARAVRFRGDWNALNVVLATRPDVLNHNTETVPRLYRQVRKGAVYERSLELLRRSKEAHPEVPTKTGLMLGLGEEKDEVLATMQDLAAQGTDILTLGQYLQPTREHLPIIRYVHPDEFAEFKTLGEAMGFKHVEAGPLVRSSYHAFDQAESAIR